MRFLLSFWLLTALTVPTIVCTNSPARSYLRFKNHLNPSLKCHKHKTEILYQKTSVFQDTQVIFYSFIVQYYNYICTNAVNKKKNASQASEGNVCWGPKTTMSRRTKPSCSSFGNTLQMFKRAEAVHRHDICDGWTLFIHPVRG